MKVKELTQEELALLKSKELEILLFFDKFCRSKGLKYSLTGGSLLGAVRHKGFIPWDDDVDVMMVREDYEKLFSFEEEFANAGFELVDFEKCAGYGYPFGKIMLKNTKMIERSVRDTKTPKGIFIDIFPVDKSPSDPKERQEIFNSIVKIKKDLLCRCKYFWDKGLLFYIGYRAKGLMLSLVPKKKYIERLNKCLLKSHSAKEYCYSYFMGGASFEHNGFPKEVFESYDELEFEGNMLMVVAEYDEFLSIRYGDYMKLPPKEEQIPHHWVLDIQF